MTRRTTAGSKVLPKREKLFRAPLASSSLPKAAFKRPKDAIFGGRKRSRDMDACARDAEAVRGERSSKFPYRRLEMVTRPVDTIR